MTGIEIAVGYVFAWVVRKSQRLSARADTEVDRVLDAGMDRVHNLVSAKLGQDPALERAREEAKAGREELTERTRRRLADALEDAAERDPDFAEAVRAAVAELQQVQHSTGAVVAGTGGQAVGGDVRISASDNSAAAWTMGDVALGNPHQPDPDQS
ncbi:hypothetical protein SAMN06272775_6008 [Streptomyces sp. 2323.1]|nr:hypothetical protein [Streptomyces sp. 2323.1]SOE15077.1 hypothetical protein SAMN06272775_6008 [Streptomyces sp. 2323.1]